nr:DNA repair exonuclease [uncultured Sphingomonas sp.]
MTTFRFLHAADIHLDSPLHGLSRYDGIPADEVRGATRAAFDNLIQRAIDEKVEFVVIAGDLFDGDWRDMGTGLYFARAMGRLDQVGIPAFILAGNHDAESVISRSVPWPPNVRQFGARKPETHVLPDLGVAIHGQSFATPAVTDNLVLAYPDAVARNFNIGMLHTALAGRQGHADYAPCSLDDLKAKRYDYWALGHVHEYELVCEEPYVVFPGNTQGRTIRETGAKGAVIVTVEDGTVVSLERVELDVLRWAAVNVDCSGSTPADAPELIREALLETWRRTSVRLPLVVRLSLVGSTTHAGAFLDGAASLRDDARAVAMSISPDLFIEKVRVLVTPPATAPGVNVGDDLAMLIGEAGSDLDLAAMLAEDLEPFLVAAKSVLNVPEDTELRARAINGDWSGILSTATLALRSRLTSED